MSAQEADPGNDAVKVRIFIGSSKLEVLRQAAAFRGCSDIVAVGGHNEKLVDGKYKVTVMYKEVEL